MNLVTVTVFSNLNDDLCAEHKKTDSWFGYGPNCAGPPGSCYEEKSISLIVYMFSYFYFKLYICFMICFINVLKCV